VATTRSCRRRRAANWVDRPHSIRNLQKSFGPKTVLRDVSLEVPRGQTFAIAWAGEEAVDRVEISMDGGCRPSCRCSSGTIHGRRNCAGSTFPRRRPTSRSAARPSTEPLSCSPATGARQALRFGRLAKPIDFYAVDIEATVEQWDPRHGEVRPAHSPPRPANLVVTSAAFP